MLAFVRQGWPLADIVAGVGSVANILAILLPPQTTAQTAAASSPEIQRSLRLSIGGDGFRVSYRSSTRTDSHKAGRSQGPPPQRLAATPETDRRASSRPPAPAAHAQGARRSVRGRHARAARRRPPKP